MSDGKSKRKAPKAATKPSRLKRLLHQDSPAASVNDEIFPNLHEKIQAKLDSIQEEKKKSSASGVKGPKRPRKGSSENFQPPEEIVSRGKKRDSVGIVVERRKNKTQAGPLKVPNNVAPPPKEPDAVLLGEVLALGGTNEDLELVNGVDSGSDSEIEGDQIEKPNDKKRDRKPDSLEKGLLNILKEIALAQKQAPESSDPSNASSNEDEVEVLSINTQRATLLPDRNLTEPTERLAWSGKRGLHCEARPDWFGYALPKVDVTKQPKYTLSQHSLGHLVDYAKSLLDTENDTYKKTQQSSSSHSFYNTVITSGTLSDKISALTLAVQESPVHNVQALETLIVLAKKRSRAQAVEVLRALKDLFAQGSLLPGDRRLYSFATQPTLVASFGKLKTWDSGDALPRGVTEGHLVVWAFESWLKEQYFEVLKTLEIWCNDEIEFSKSRAVSYVYELLKEKPEQESNLLRLLINKLGDPIKKIASQTSYLIMQLLSVHPAMKSTVVSVIEADFIYRPGQSLHGKYYAVVTLNQTALSVQEQDVAVKLLDIYFGLFVALLKPVEDRVKAPDDDGLTRGQQRRRKERVKKSDSRAGDTQEYDLSEKLISAILTGVNRAYPYAEKDGHDLGSHLDTLFKITHSSNFNTSIQAMMLIQQFSSSHQSSADRFYRTLYESLLDPRLVSSSKQQLYLNLLHRALKADLNLKRVKAFVKRILQILTIHEPSFICGAFFLVSDLQNTYPGLKALLDQPEDHDLDDDEHFQDVHEEVPPEDQSTIHPDRRHLTSAPLAPNAYNPRKRDPEHSNAETSCAWDLLPFLVHFHPSVTASAEHLLRHTKLPGKPDLSLHTLSHFLDRFVYRNPKLASANLRGSSIMQPMANDDSHAVLINTSIGGKKSLPVNSEQFRTRKGDNIAADDVFFHKYFSGLGKEPATKKSKKTRTEMEEEIGSVGDEEDEVWKAMKDSAPALEGDDGSDEDLEMSDLESEFDEDDEGISGSDGPGLQDDEIEGDIFDASDDEMLDLQDVDHVDSDNNEGSEVAILSTNPDKEANSKRNSRDKPSTTSRERKRKMKALPTFASASDYAKMLEDDTDEDMG